MKTKQFEELFKSSAKQLNLKIDLETAGAYAAERAAYLSTLVGLPGFDLAVIAERDNVFLRSGLSVTQAADKVGSMFLGIIQGALVIGATS